MEDNENSLINPPVKPLPDLDLTTNDGAMTRLQSPYALDLDTTNKLFNPMEWQKTLDGQLIKRRKHRPAGGGGDQHHAAVSGHFT